MNDKVIIYGLRLVSFMVVSLVVMCFYALSLGKSLEPVSIIVTSLVSLITGLIGYFWGASHKGGGNGPTSGSVLGQPQGIAPTVVLLVASCLLMSGCGLFKHGVTTTDREVASYRAVTSVDTTRDSSRVTQVATTDSHYSDRQESDTAIGLAGGSVKVNLAAGSLDTGGVTVKRGNVTLRANQNRDGSLDIECTSDSLTLVINNLVRISDSSGHSRDSVITSQYKLIGGLKDSLLFTSKRSLKVVDKEPWYTHWLWLLCGAVGGAAVVCVVRIVGRLKPIRP